MKRAFALGVVLSFPFTTAAYEVTRGSAPVADKPSRFQRYDLPASRFEPKPRTSGMQASSVSSSFDLKAMDSNLRAKVQNTLAGLNARQDGLNIVVRLPSDVLFDFDRADIRADAKPVLARLSEALVAMPDRPVSITGHTDSLGSDDYNHTLSERRSVAVREWLSRLRVRRERMTVQGMGEAKPVAPNQNPDGSDNPDGRQKNRRVDFVIGEGR